jgi:hypothetical protein
MPLPNSSQRRKAGKPPSVLDQVSSSIALDSLDKRTEYTGSPDTDAPGHVLESPKSNDVFDGNDEEFPPSPEPAAQNAPPDWSARLSNVAGLGGHASGVEQAPRQSRSSTHTRAVQTLLTDQGAFYRDQSINVAYHPG